MKSFSNQLPYIFVGLLLWCMPTGRVAAQTAAGSAEPSAPDTIILSEADVLRIALSENATVRVADLDVRKQAYARRVAQADLLPKVDVNGVYSRTLKKQVMYIDMPGFGSGDGIEVGRTHNTQATLNVTMPLISAQLWKNIAMTGEQLDLALEQARSSRIDLVATVRKAYLSVLLAQDSYAVFKRSYDNAQANYRNISAKYDQGLVAEYDKIRANVQVRNIEPNLLQAQNSVAIALWQLKVLMSMDVDTPIQLSGSLSDFKEEVYRGYFTVDTVASGNSSLRQLDIQRRLAVSADKLNRYSFLPTLSLGGQYSYMLSSNEFKFWGDGRKWTPYSTISLSLNIPIFNGGKRLHNVKQSSLAIRQIDIQRSHLEQSLRMGIKNQNNLLRTYMRKYVASEEAVRSAEKGYQIAEKRYQTGEGTLIELNDADVALLQAQLNYNQSIYDFMAAKAELDKMNGTGVPEDEGK